MTYKIDFTYLYYRRRKRWIAAISVFFCLAVLGICQLGLWCYDVWTSPTLNQQLATYEDMADKIVALHDKWESAEESYEFIESYYRMVWMRSSITNLLSNIADYRLPNNLKPLAWEIDTVDACSLKYRLDLAAQQTSKRQLCKNAESILRNMMLDNSAYYHDESFNLEFPDKYLLDMSSMDFTIKFKLEAVDASKIPVMPKRLEDIAGTIQARSKSLLECELAKGAFDGKTVQTMLGDAFAEIRGKLEPEDAKRLNSEIKTAIDPAAVLQRMKNALPAGSQAPDGFESIFQEWGRLATRRLPWMRFEKLDNDELASEIAAMRALIDSALLAVNTDIDSIVAAIDEMRKPFFNGYDEGAVFDEGVLNDCVARLLRINSLPPRNANVQRENHDSEILMVAWSMGGNMEGSGHGRGKKKYSAANVLDFISGIHALGNGMQIGRVSMSMNDGTAVGRYDIKGLVPVTRKESE